MKKTYKINPKKKQAVSTLSTDNLIDAATSRLHELENILPLIEDSHIKDSNERLRVISKGNSFQYYIVPKGAITNGIYLHAKQISKAATIAQQDYNKNIATQIKQDIKVLKTFIQGYHPERIDFAYEKLCSGRKQITTPIRYPDQEYVKRWTEVSYNGKAFEDSVNEFVTDKGIRVRSKSELIIANKLSKAGVPFRYEAPLIFENPRHIQMHPDFTCLNIHTRKEVIWEHFGLMDDPDYADNAFQKIGLYAANGYKLGDNFLATFENGRTTLSHHLVTQFVEMLAK